MAATRQIDAWVDALQMSTDKLKRRPALAGHFGALLKRIVDEEMHPAPGSGARAQRPNALATALEHMRLAVVALDAGFEDAPLFVAS